MIVVVAEIPNLAVIADVVESEAQREFLGYLGVSDMSGISIRPAVIPRRLRETST